MRFVLLVALGMRVSAVAAEIHRFAVAFAPFEKGGHGGFALDPALLEQNQKQIPRHRFAMPAPFCKRGYKNKRTPALAVDLEYKLCIVGIEFRLSAVAFAPFEKGGHGGFALDPALLEQNQKQIPRHRFAMPAPFCKGGYKNKRSPALAVDLEYKLCIVGLEFRLFAVAFAPFEKGGHGGFALDSALLEQNQEQIPRHRFAMPAPFCKGGCQKKTRVVSSVRPPCRDARPAGCAGRWHPR